MQAANPLVSVIIPTRNRPKLLLRAIQSVLTQTYQQLEIVVVIDGPDESTLAALSELKDSRIHPVPLTKSVGGAEARNVGAREARGEWIALLDDDDEWLPEKLRAQVEAAGSIGFAQAVIASQYIDRNGIHDMVRPREFQRPGQHISDYLFGTVSLFHPRQGFLQTSTLFAPRSLFVQVPFTRGLKRNQETDWLLRAVPHTGKEAFIVPKILAIFHNEQTPKRVSSTVDWEYTFEWALANKGLFTRAALGAFLSTVCMGIVMKQPGAYRNAGKLVRACFAHAAITPKVLGLLFRNMILVPTYRWLSPDFVVKATARLIYR
jgi:glycosyltransferase involved in cell wall biosynthesis